MNVSQNKKSIEVLLRTCNTLLRPHVQTHALEARVLIGHVLGMSEKELIMQGQQEVCEKTHDKIFQLIEQRIQGVPLAYLTGEKEFYGRSFCVNADVLIPRVESELVVEQALSCAKATPQTILDVGTGSGCIGITLAAELSKGASSCKVLLSDNSTRALRLAETNAQKILGAEGAKHVVRLYHWDVRESLKTMQPYMHDEKTTLHDIKIIVANLPYVAPQEYKYAQNTLMHEPYQALVGSSTENGSDGFFFIRKLFEATAELQHNHALVLECDPLQIDKVLEKAGHSNYKTVRIAHDLRGLPRVCVLSSLM